jgi:osmotically-inducible protein OsmY
LLYQGSKIESQTWLTAENRIVTLTGKVSNYAEKYAASEAAARVNGVKTVTDEMRMNLPSSHQRDDQDIAEAALNAFE